MKALQYSILPHTDPATAATGFLLTVRDPYTGTRGTGFYLTHPAALCAYGKALDRYERGGNPCEYLDIPGHTER